jgi:hypothetical protein
MDFFSKARAGRTVFKRTTKSKEHPEHVLYMEWLPGQMKRRVLDTEGNEIELGDKVLESQYRYITSGQAKAAVEKYWPKVKVPGAKS